MENARFPDDTSYVLCEGSDVVQSSTHMRPSTNPVPRDNSQGDATSMHAVENDQRNDEELDTTHARGFTCVGQNVFIRTVNGTVNIHGNTKTTEEHDADTRKEQTEVTPTHNSQETNRSEAVGNENNLQGSRASVATPTTRRKQSVHERLENGGGEAGHSTSDRKKPSSRKCLKVFLPIAAITAGLGLLALILALSLTRQELFSTKAKVQLRVDDTFEEDMANASSDTSRRYGVNFCYNIEGAVKDEMTLQNCLVTGLRSGSVIVDFEARLGTTESYTAQELEALLKKSGKRNGQFTSFGHIKALTTSIKIDILGTDFRVTTSTNTSTEATTATTTAGTTTAMRTTGVNLNTTLCSKVNPNIMSNSSSMYVCPVNGTRYVPHLDTYPHRCAESKWCSNGTVVLSDFRCPPGSVFILRHPVHPCQTEDNEESFCEQMKLRQWCRNNGWTEAEN